MQFFLCSGEKEGWCVVVAVPHEGHSSTPQSATGPLGCVRLIIPASGKWRVAALLPRESHSSTQRTATGPLGCVRMNVPRPRKVACYKCDALWERFIHPKKRHRTSGTGAVEFCCPGMPPAGGAGRLCGLMRGIHQSHKMRPD